MSIEKHPTRSGWYYVKSYPNGRNGKPHRDLIEGYAAASALDVSIKKAKGTPVAATVQPRIETFADEYLEWGDRYLSPKTMEGKRKRVKDHILPVLGKYRVIDITQGILDEYGKKHTPINYRGDINHLKAMVSYAKKRKLCTGLTFEPEIPSYSAPIKALPKVNDVIKFLNAVANPQHKVCMEMMLYTGLRFYECKMLKWENYEVDHFIVKKTKSNRERIVWIPEALRKHFEERQQKEGFVFSNTNGKTPWATILRPMQNARKKSGVYLTPHMFRHLAATIFYQQSGDLYAVAKMLGHSRVTTSEIYARYAANIAQQATNSIIDYMSQTAKPDK